jgi:hypothetical protein
MAIRDFRVSNSAIPLSACDVIGHTREYFYHFPFRTENTEGRNIQIGLNV